MVELVFSYSNYQYNVAQLVAINKANQLQTLPTLLYSYIQ